MNGNGARNFHLNRSVVPLKYRVLSTVFHAPKIFGLNFGISVLIIGRHVVSFCPRLLDAAYRMCSNSLTGSF